MALWADDEIAPDLRIQCREVQIAQALSNLVQNSLDAVLEQEGERWVRLRVSTRGGLVTLSVVDSGPGIPPEMQHRLMEPFFTTKAPGKGTGLGLSIAKKITEEHGGRLEFSVQEGHTCFSLLIPMSVEIEVAAGKAAKSMVLEGSTS